MNKRKHYSQMSQDETAAVINAVRSIRKANTTPYFRTRMQERAISNVDIALTLTQGKIIEAHNNNAAEVRILVQALVRNKLCNVVISLTTKNLITCYWNNLNDTHRTLDKSAYKWNVNLKTVI